MASYGSKFKLGPLTTNHKFGHIGFVIWREKGGQGSTLSESSS